MRLSLLPMTVALVLSLSACTAQERAAARTALDIARDLCTLSQAERLGIKPEDVARELCEADEKAQQWLPHVLAAQQAGTAAAEAKAP